MAKPAKTRQPSSKNAPKRAKPARSKAPSGRAHRRQKRAPSQTKLARLRTLLQRKEGATIADLTAATGWQAHSVRGALSGTFKKKLELSIASEKVEGRGRVYKIVERD